MTKFPDKAEFPEPTFTGKPASSRSQSKTGFMLELLNSGSLSEAQKLKFLELSIQELKEMESGGELAKKAIEMVEQLREEVGGKSEKKESTVEEAIVVTKEVSKKSKKSKVEERHWYEKIHNPKKTSDFLLLFKKANSGFKELMHPPDNDRLNLVNYLDKIKSHPIISEGRDVEHSMHINYALRQEVKDLIRTFEKEGLDFWYKNKKHPYGKSDSYTKKINNFKANYRFGALDETYSNLKNVIKNIVDFAEAYRVGDKNKSINLEFGEDFLENSFFSTYIPAFKNGLNILIGDILQWSNYDKTIIDLRCYCTCYDEDYVTKIILIDYGSVLMKPPSDLKKDYMEKKVYLNHFRSLCDWEIDFIYKNEAYKLEMLSDDVSFSEPRLSTINQKIIGFTHIFKFYHG